MDNVDNVDFVVYPWVALQLACKTDPGHSSMPGLPPLATPQSGDPL